MAATHIGVPRAASSGRVPDAWLKPGILLGALTPLVSLVARGLTGTLDANPIAQIENELGLAALVFLIACLDDFSDFEVGELIDADRYRR